MVASKSNTINLCQPYAAISRIYDRWVSDINYEQAARFILAHFHADQYETLSCLDIGCGTGSLMLDLGRAGIKVTGVDRSVEMLDLARQKICSSELDRLLTISRLNAAKQPWPIGPYDLIVCTFDSANYFSSLELGLVIARAWHALKNDGLFIFDVNSEHKLREVFGNSAYGETFEDYAYIWQNRLSQVEDSISFDITLFLLDETITPARYSRYREVHNQYIHAPYDISNELQKCGFASIEITGNYSSSQVTDQTMRLTITARKGA